MKGGLAAEELELATDIGGYSLDPGGFSKYVFPWESEQFPSAGPRTWQSEIMDQIKAHLGDDEKRFHPLQLAVASGHSIGKALRPDDFVPTPQGLRLVSDIQIGDLLFGENGNRVRVKGVKSWILCPFYKVTFSDGSSVDCSSGHLWKVKSRSDRRLGRDWRVLETEEIYRLGIKRPNGANVVNVWTVPRAKAVAYEDSLLPVDPYTYGVWLGDGDKASGRITNIDPEVWENVAYPFRGTGKTRTLLGLKVAMRKAGLRGCTTYNASVDRRYIEHHQRLSVLQGLLDTDGWVEVCGGAAFASASRQLTRDVIELARSLGLRARMEKFKKNDHAGSWATHITWDGKTPLFRIKRKQDKLINPSRWFNDNWIESIDPVEAGSGICFEVEGGLFLTRDFVVTHNSALISMIMSWAMSTCEDCKIVVTAGTGTQLATKTAPEVQKWFRMAINTHWWDINATSIRVKDPLHQAMWRADFITWSIQKTEAFAGLHNLGKRIVIIFDEASAIDDKIWEVTEGALADEGTEIIWIAFGNPTRNSGAFYKAITGANRWKSRQIDARTVEGTNKVLLDAQIKEWGEDSDRARVRIRGEFPRGGSTQFIPGDLVAAARLRVADGYQRMPVILAVDVARFGDNKSVICKRQGRKAEFIGKFYGSDTQIVGAKVQEAIDREHPDAVVIDGDGIGGAVYDFLKARGYDRKTTLVEFHGGHTAQDPNKYLNRRAEVWGDMKDWLVGGDIPDEASIDTDLTGPDYGYHPTRGCIALETKDDMRSRGVDSPDEGDALAMSFAVKVAPPKPKSDRPKPVTSSWG